MNTIDLAITDHGTSDPVSRERRAFSARLIASLTKAGVDVSAAVVAREFNIRAGAMVTGHHGVRKWLVGEAFPTQARLHVLAHWLNVSAQWLRFGEGMQTSKSKICGTHGLSPKEVMLLTDIRRLDTRSQAVLRELVTSLLKHR